jgi:superfamily II DNA or RNA helicase
MWMMSFENIKGYVYYTSKISSKVKAYPKNRIEYIKKPLIENVITSENNIIKPFDYQIEASSKFIDDRGILSMPCGTGKTMTSYLISQKFKQIIILSPLKEFAKQNLNRYIEYGYENKTLLVSSDGCRDIEEINKFIISNKSFLISGEIYGCLLNHFINRKITNIIIIICIIIIIVI